MKGVTGTGMRVSVAANSRFRDASINKAKVVMAIAATAKYASAWATRNAVVQLLVIGTERNA